MSRKLFTALFIVLSGVIFAGEARTFAPTPDTPVIPWTRFNVQYAVRVIGSEGPTKVVFYITTDNGATWNLYGEDPDLKSPMVINVPGEGTYGFSTIIATNLRPANPPRSGTRPDRFVIVDRTPPTASWISPAGGEIALNANGSINLAWDSSDEHLGLTPIMLEYSTDGGNFWLPLREKLPAKGSINWTPPLLEGENEIALRLVATDIAGNRRIVKNHARFQIDRQPPLVSITGPRLAGGYEFDVNYRATDDQSGIGQVELYYTVNDGQEWFFFDSDKDLSNPVMKFNSPPAKRVGLYLVGADKRGNRTPPPAKGARPMLEVELDLQAPQVTIMPPFSSTGTVIGKTDPAQLRWSSSDINIKENSTTLEYSTDGGSSWNSIASNLPGNGAFSWTPNLTGDNILLKVSVDDQLGNKGTALSMPFRIDDKRPSTKITDIRPIGTPDAPQGGQPSTFGNTAPATRTGGTDPWAPNLPGSSAPVAPVAAPEGTTGNADLAIPGTYDPMGTSAPGASGARTAPAAPAASLDLPTTTTSTAPSATSTPVAPGTPVTGAQPSDIDIPSNFTAAPIDNSVAGIPGISTAPGTPSAPAMPVAPTASTTPVAPVGSVAPVTPGVSVTPGAPGVPVAPVAPAGGNNGGMALPPIPGDIPSIGAPAGGSIDNSIPAVPGGSAIPGMNIPDVPAIPGTSGIDPLSDDNLGKTTPAGKPTNTAAGSATAPATPAVSGSPAQMLEQAEQAYANGNEQDVALGLAKQALDKDPNNPRGYALLASIYTEKEQYEDALNNAQRATRLAPSEPRYLQVLGYALYSKANSITNAIRDKNIPADQVRGFTAQAVQALEDSEKAYQQMLSTGTKNSADIKEAYYRLGQIDYFRATRILRDDNLAAASLRQSIANYEKAYAAGTPEYREVLQIGICNYRLQDYDQAERWLVKAQELSAANRPPKEAFFYLAMIHEKMERPEQALPFWKKVASLYPNGSKYQQLAASRVSALEQQIKP